MRWILLLQLSNLTPLMLEAHSSQFGTTAMFVHLPNLKHLRFKIDLGPAGGWRADVCPEGFLESIISSTKKLVSLSWECISGVTYFSIRYDVIKLKQII
ncbi:uncharacterized protein BDV17DRAFT_253558 [Aspergillus undulatus]|uniref:uncharacterized protein n=1 Tax=Aspergillus undulatus TaxID=1810928 RepID=UPI003CCD7D35